MNKSPHIYLIPIALAISFLLIGYEVEKVFADAEIFVITPTGGGLTATADCTDITANTVVWLNCSDTQKLFAISLTTNAVLANITTSGALNTLQASISGSSVFVNNPTANTVTKYLFSGGIITQQSLWTAPCNIDTNLNYDNSGYLWLTCSPTDQIVRLNPNTMGTALLASTGATCTSPDKIHFTQTGNKGIVHCLNGGLADTIMMFSIATSTTINVLDTETTTSGTINVMIDGAHNTVLAPSSSIMSVWTYTSGGALTLSQTITGNTYDQCDIEPYNIASTGNLFALCEVYSAPNTIANAFLINSTGVFQVFNGAVAYTDASAIGYDINTDSTTTWYVSANSNNEKYIKITGVRTIVDTNPVIPEPPSGGGSTTGINCALPENENILTCRLGGDGTIAGAGDFIIGDGSEGTGLSGIACSIGFVDCSVNDDVKTNGIGYLIFIAGIAIMFGLFWMVTKGHVTEIPTFIWIISILSLAGAFALFNIIDPVVFIVTIVAIVALAVPKIISTVRGDGTTLGAGNTS